MRKILFILFFFYCFHCVVFAQQPEVENRELISLSRVKGIVSVEKIGTQELLILTTEQANFSLIGEIAEKEIKPRKDLENKEISLLGIESTQQKEISDTKRIYDSRGSYLTDQKSVFRYKNFEVLYLESIQKLKGEAKVPPAIAAEEEPLTLTLSKLSLFHALKEPTLNLCKIKGKVVFFNPAVKAPISTLKIEYKSKGEKQSLVAIIPQDTKVMKVVDEQLMQLGVTAIKIGSKVDMWYEQKGDQNFARIITILDKD